MRIPETEIQTKNPTDLLRDQVRLLNEINQSLAELQKLQQQMRESIAGLYELNRDETALDSGVVVRDIHMPFLSMVGFIIKWSIASIPALIVLGLLGAVIWAVLGGLFMAALR